MMKATRTRAAGCSKIGRHRLAVSQRLDEVAFKSVPARLASLLLDMAQREGGAQPARLPRRSHRQLAEMINAYRETVTKVIKQFRAARLLEIDRSTITLLNRPGWRSWRKDKLSRSCLPRSTAPYSPTLGRAERRAPSAAASACR